MNILFLDLELNKNNDFNDKGNTTDIIQIGACVLNTQTGEIIETFNRFIKLKTPLDNGELRLSKFIITLTGITDEQVNNGTSLIEAYEDLVEFSKKHNCIRPPAQWGSGDIEELKMQLDNEPLFVETLDNIPEDKRYKYREMIYKVEDRVVTTFQRKFEWHFSKYFPTGVFDVKKMYQAFRIANGQKYQGGLKKAINVLNLKLPPNMSYHDAVADAVGTALVYKELTNMMKEKK